MFKATVLIAFLVMATNCLGPLTKAQHMDVLAQLHSHPLGESIFSQLSLYMSSQGPIGDVVAMCQGLVVELGEQQAATDAVHAEARATCNQLLPEYAAQISSNADAQATCLQTVADTEDLKADAEDQLAGAQDELASVTHRLETGQGIRDTEHAAWSELNDQHVDGIAACQDALNLVSSMQRGALFIQLQGRVKSVASRLETMTHMDGKFTAYQPLITSFAQIASSSSNPALLGEISGLLTTLKDQITATQQADEGWENDKAAAWEKERSDLATQQQNLNNRIAGLEGRLVQYAAIIEEQSAKAIFHEEEVGKYTYLLAQQTEWCEAEQAHYDHETATRNEETRVLGQLIEYLESRMSSVEDFIMMKQTEGHSQY